MHYRLVTFDVTNTLLKFRTTSGLQYAKVASLYGVKADAEELSRAFKSEWKELNLEDPNYGASKIKAATSSEWWKLLVSRTFSSAGYPLDGKNLAAISEHLIHMYHTSACWDIRPGAREVLHCLRQKKFLSLGVISNFDDSLHSVMSSTGLLPFFDFVLASYNVRCYKPQNQIFDLALKHANCMPREAVHIGDDVHLDYLGARKAGWDALLLLPDNAKLDATVDIGLVDSTSIAYDIRDVIFKMENRHLQHAV